MPAEPTPELGAALLAVAVEAAALAAARVGAALLTERAGVVSKSTTTDLVTETDKAVEALVVDHIRRARPSDGFLGEEGASDPGTSGVRWIIDPIDGTTNFVYGFPSCCTSIAAEVADAEGRRTVLAGVVHEPTRGEVFTGVRGGGASLRTPDGRVVSLAVRPSGPPIGEALVGTGFGYDASQRAAQGAVLASVVSQVRDVRRGGSCALDLCSLAAGRLDAYYERGPHLWDVAAAGLIAVEAGAVIGALEEDRSLEDLEGDVTVVATRPDLWDPLRSLLVASGAGGPLA